MRLRRNQLRPGLLSSGFLKSTGLNTRFHFIAVSVRQIAFGNSKTPSIALRDIGPRTINFHISSKKTAGERSDLLREFVSHKRTLMTNARCLTEGVDVPAIDCVVFADPKQSRIDIVQAAGRALRRYPGKDYGYILLPLIVPQKMNFEDFAETTAFRQVASTITALSTQDERIAEEFRAIERGRISSGKIVEIEGDVPVGMKIKLGDFAEAISTRLWQSVGRANWRKFEDARAFVRGLGLKSTSEWRSFYQSSEKPSDIPSNPNRTYANAGWLGWGDWLGTHRIADQLHEYRAFHKARSFVRELGLKSTAEWQDYCASGKKPHDIPAAPWNTYAKAGWAGAGDWLGTETLATQARPYRSFASARTFVRRLGLKYEAEWREYCKSGKKPHDIPATPSKIYAAAGWLGMRDWLGTSWLSFAKSRAFVRGLGLKSEIEWRDYYQSGDKPDNVPSHPERTYSNDGWAGWGDWLGTDQIADKLREYRPFEKARAFARALGLESERQWRDYCKSGKKPNDIPANPGNTYAEAGWSGYGDWLGTARHRGTSFRPFKDARIFVRRLGLKSFTAWRNYCQSGKKPHDVPSSPPQMYAEAGWSSWGDWLGTGRVADKLREYRPFEKARVFARALRLKSGHQWRDYCKSGKKPNDIPAAPNVVYANNGWDGLSDWLGTARRRGTGHLRTFARSRTALV